MAAIGAKASASCHSAHQCEIVLSEKNGASVAATASEATEVREDAGIRRDLAALSQKPQ
jgi:hypothetical protein